MKKQLTTLILLLFSIIALGQTEYGRGFKNGYSEGYCYKDYGCIAPIPPITPIPYIGESNDSYQDGYNRGFKLGLEKKSVSNLASSYSGSQSGSGGTINWSKPQSMYVPMNNDIYTALYQDAARKSAAAEDNTKKLEIIMQYIIEIEKKSTDKDLLDAAKNTRAKMDKYGEDHPHIRMSDISDLLYEVENDLLVATAKANRRLELKTLYDQAVEAYKNQKWDDVIYNTTPLIAADPKNANLYYLRGLAYEAKKSYALGIEDFDKSLNINQNQPKVFGSRGNCKSAIKDDMGAISDYNKEIELNPSSAYAYYNRGEVKDQLGDHSGAINDYNKSIELKPDFSMAYNNIAWSLYLQKKYPDALKMINKAITVDPNNSTAYDSRQEIKFALNDFQGCIDDCNAVAYMDSKNANSIFFRGRANYKLGNKTKACEDWSKAGELGKSDAYDFIKKFCK